jgi:epoxyqueuosine reductase
MDKREFESAMTRFILDDTRNIVEKVRIFEAPLFAYGSPTDQMYQELKDKEEANLPDLMLPKEWLSSAKTCVAGFLPFTEQVRLANKGGDWAAQEWLYARIEGQSLMNELLQWGTAYLKEKNCDTVVPSLSKNFHSIENKGSNDWFADGESYTSTWSERHNAYICGLGTFGLSKGLITKKGIAGRYFSWITEADFEKDHRTYSSIYEYCTQCGACIRRCPARAINEKAGKNHDMCAGFLNITRKRFSPRYGCGKCQCGVPCEYQIPDKNKKAAET